MPRPVSLVFFTMSAAVVGRLSSLLCQLIVGYYLTDTQIGAFAFALGVTGITGLLRGGGDTQEFLSMRPEAFAMHASRIFWWGVIFWITGAVLTGVMAALSETLSQRWSKFGTPELSACLWMLGLRQFLTPFAQVFRMSLGADLRFGFLSKVDTATALVRILVTVIAARMGLGAMALAGPLVIQMFMEIVLCAPVAGLSRSHFRWVGLSFVQTAKQMRWPLVVSVLSMVNTQLGFLVAGLVASISSLGLFYFAFQLANAPRLLVVQSVQSITGPLVARSREDTQAGLGLVKTIYRAAFLFFPLITGSTAAFFPLFNQLVWADRWGLAIESVAVLSVGFTFMGIMGIMIGSLTGLRRFRRVAGIEFVRSCGLMVGIFIGGFFGEANQQYGWLPGSSVTWMSVGTSLGMTLTCGFLLWKVGREIGFLRSEVLAIMFFGPMLGALMATAAQAIIASAKESAAGTDSTVVNLAALCLGIPAYCLSFVLVARFHAQSTVIDALELLPMRPRQFLESLLGLQSR
jgi:O-antigen/teichoic acid export membrane protein